MPLGSSWGFHIFPPCSALAEHSSGWWVVSALRRLQCAGTGKQGHVMDSQGSLSCQELHLGIVSLHWCCTHLDLDVLSAPL